MQAKYNIYLARSSDMEYIADLTTKAKNKNLQLALNRSGSFSCEVKLGNLWKDEMVAVKNCIVIEKNNVPVWSGPIWGKQEDFVTQKMSLNAVGWFELLRKRILLEEMTFTDTKDGEIAFALLEYANQQTVGEGVLEKVIPTPITPGIQASLSLRDIEYEFGQNIGEEIENLTEIEGGFDFDIDPITRKMNIRNWDDYSDLDEVVFAYNWGPNNLSSFSRSTNADSMGNEWFVAGEGIVAEAYDTSSINFHQALFQEMINLTETNDPNILGAIANAELIVNRNPGIIFSLAPKSNTHSIFEDYNIGDQVYITAKSDGVEISEQAVRIFGASISIDDLGNEKVDGIQTTYQGQ